MHALQPKQLEIPNTTQKSYGKNESYFLFVSAMSADGSTTDINALLNDTGNFHLNYLKYNAFTAIYWHEYKQTVTVQVMSL